MTRIEAGDYLLPSNDATTLWRLMQCEEDGSAGFTGRYWSVWRYLGGTPERFDPNDWDDWGMWESWAGPFATRRDALTILDK